MKRILFLFSLSLPMLVGCIEEPASPTEQQTKIQPPGWQQPVAPKLDLDGDGTVDFEFIYTEVMTTDVPPSGGSRNLEILPFNGSRLLYVEKVGSRPLADSTFISAKVGSDERWSSYPLDLASDTWHREQGWDSLWSGSWAGVSRRCLPLEVKVGGMVHYAWVRISVDATTGAVTIHGYGYQRKAGEGIYAGEG